MAWIGAGIVVAAGAGLGVYLVSVELEKADKLASVIAMFIALVGLAVVIYDLLFLRDGGRQDPSHDPASDIARRISVRQRIHRLRSGRVAGIRGRTSASDIRVDQRVTEVGGNANLVGYDGDPPA